MAANTPPLIPWWLVTKNNSRLRQMRLDPGHNDRAIDDEMWSNHRSSFAANCLKMAEDQAKGQPAVFVDALAKHFLDAYSWHFFCKYLNPSFICHNIMADANNSQGRVSHVTSLHQ